MDHKLIDQALTELLSTKRADRTIEQIQGFAHLVCNAAGITIDSLTPTLAGLPALHAAVSLLATNLDVESLKPTSSVTTQVSLYNRSPARISAHIYNPHGFGDATCLSGHGYSPEEVLRDLRNKAHDRCKLEVE